MDCWSCKDQVREDVTGLIAEWLAGNQDRESNTIFEWVAGPLLKDLWHDERRRILADHFAQYIWRLTEMDEGFVIGATDDNLGLGGVMMINHLRTTVSKGYFDNSSHYAQPGSMNWQKFKDARRGVKARIRALRKQLEQHDRDMKGRPHIFLRTIGYSTHQMHLDKPEEGIYARLLGVATNYADHRSLPLYTQTADLQDVRALEKFDFRLLEQFDFMASNDPDQFYSLRAVSTMIREPRAQKQTA